MVCALLASLRCATHHASSAISKSTGRTHEINVLLRESGKVIGSFGRPGRMAGEFRNLHNIAIDSKGNIYTAEAGFGRRVQKFKPQ